MHLRMRRLPEKQIVDVLRSVDDLARESGRAPQEQFGPAAPYAGSFPKGSTSSTARRVALSIVTVALAVMAIDRVLILVQAAALVTAFLVERHLPRDSTTTAADHGCPWERSAQRVSHHHGSYRIALCRCGGSDG
jgi:hypothetical protein